MSPTPASEPASRSTTMSESARAASGAGGGVARTWRRLNFEQRVAGVGALLLVVSTFGPFSFVEAAIALTGLAVLALLRQRAEGRRFHLPSGDGTVIVVAALWSALLIVVRIFDRPLGQSALALGCAAILAAAGLRERAKRPADDLPGAPRRHAPEAPGPAAAGPAPGEEATVRLSSETEPPRRPPPAGGPAPGEAETVRLPGEAEPPAAG